jgi:hypothetical protein
MSKIRKTSDPDYITEDVQKLLKFISMYCDRHHSERDRALFNFQKGKTPVQIDSGPPLCGECTALLRHAIVKRVLCPLDPKPKCRKCPEHCYRPNFHAQMDTVMRYSGPRSLFRRS